MMKMTYNDFIAKWSQIRKQRNSYLSFGNFHPLNISLGYGINSRKSLIIEDTGVIESIPSSFAIQAVNPQLENGIYALEFQLVAEKYEEEFLRLCWDMAESTLNSKNPLQDLIARYLSWQKLLQYKKDEIMSFERQKGLIGELFFFKKLLEKYNPKETIAAWQGPEGADQDFVFNNTWAEIKTVAISAEKVKVSSLQQLDQPMEGKLVIYALEKTAKNVNSVSLPDIVSTIKKQYLSDPLLAERFEIKLFKYGYRQREEEFYALNHFRLAWEKTFSVSKEFPRLIKNNVPSEITNCVYEISLPSLTRFLCGENT